MLKPSLVYEGLWHENIGIDAKNGRTVMFDAFVLYAHNEYELGMWRGETIRIGIAHIKEYLRHYPPSQPATQSADRDILYSIKFSLTHSSG